MKIRIEDIATYPYPGMSIPSALSFSPDDRWITYLLSSDFSLTCQLYRHDTQTGEQSLLFGQPTGGITEENLSSEEMLRRERQRKLELGVTFYAWNAKGDRLLVPLSDGLYVLSGDGSAQHRIVDGTQHPVVDPRFSPNGEWIAFVQEQELFVVPAAGGNPRQLTFGAGESGRTHGLAEFVAQEEMGRSQGFWWSKDSTLLAYTEADESNIPIYRIVHQGKDRLGVDAQEDHHYPFAGQANAMVRLGVISREGGDTIWLDLGDEKDIYLARVCWLPDGGLVAQIENRLQTQLDLIYFEPSTWKKSLLLRETSQVWINMNDLFMPLKEDPYRKGFIWGSERTGFRHLYLYDSQGKLVRPLTSGEWMVDALAGVDEKSGLVYFTASKESPLESHLYVISLEGGEPRRLTHEPGMHAVTLDHGRNRFVDVYDSLLHPPALTLRSLVDGSSLKVIYDRPDPRLEQLGLEPPEVVKLYSRDGTALYGAIYCPQIDGGKGSYPVVVSVYGGPNAQLVFNGWRRTVDMRAQYLRQEGYLVFVLDNRGSARRGLDFEGAIWHKMGDQEVKDQVDGIRWLVSKGIADPERVGVIGWSYGGYMTLMCLARAPEIFRAGVSGAPVTSWDGYDTHYTERYMGTPQDNPEGYRMSSILQHIGNITGDLLIIHGLIDENVHFRHTARLINSLIQNRKPYRLLLFPDERHMPRRLADRIFMEEQILDFFASHLAKNIRPL